MTVSPPKKKPVYAALSISHHYAELAVFCHKTLSIKQAVSVSMPDGLLDPELDTIQNAALLKDLISGLFLSTKPRPNQVHLSLPGTLLRLVEMPNTIDASSLYFSLSSEAERYKTFDNSEAAVDFVLIDNAQLSQNTQHLVLGALRKDSLSVYLKILKELKIKVHTIGLEPLNVLRGMAGTGVLDSLMQQVGTDAHWGMMLVDSSRIRFSLWRFDQLVEFRELSMNTRGFDNAAQDPAVVEDLLEEIRRTTKALQPVLWLTHNLPSALADALSSQLGCPVRNAPMGNAISMTQPVSLSAVGAAMTSVVTFPFDFDISVNLNQLEGKGEGVSGIGDSRGGEAPAWLMPLGLASIALGCLGTAILWIMASFIQAQIPDTESKVEGVKVEVSGLRSRQETLKRKAELDQTLIQLLEKAKIRNLVYVALTNDLRTKTPEQVWIQTLDVNDGLALSGKALNHKSVINFAKSFDTAPYTKAILIDSIMEGRMSNSLVYDFKISGGINLDRSLLPQREKSDMDSSGDETPPPRAGA
jgi:hypothetical protein